MVWHAFCFAFIGISLFMAFTGNLSIRDQITVVVMATVIVVLLIASAAFLATEFHHFRHSLVEGCSYLAEWAARDGASSLYLEDRSSADRMLMTFKKQPDILAAHILDQEDRIFSSYYRNPLAIAMEQTPSNVQKEAVRMAAGGETHQYHRNYLSYYRPILRGNSRLGALVLHADLADLHRRTAVAGGVSVLILLVTAALAYLIAGKLHRIISAPILDLAQTVRKISSRGDYAIRHQKAGGFEVGTLTDGLNEMLSGMGEREAEWQQHTKHLEELVQELTREQSRISEALEAAIAELKAANMLKSQFLANMSHELRTPLNHVIGFTEIVLSQRFGRLNETQLEYLSDTLSSSRHLLALINDILDLAKIEAGEEQLEISEVALKKTISDSIALVKTKSIRHQIDLSSPTNNLPEFILADERKFKHILYNLLSNAIKFTPDGGAVTLHAKRVDFGLLGQPGKDRSNNKKYFTPSGLKLSHFIYPPAYGIQFSVSDTGIGIKEEDRDRIFQPFEQADGSSTRKFEGTGLGLSVTKRIVEMHGGAIWVESGGLNKGATFHFVLPILDKES
jgi:signal transduction histidine kinase